MPSPVFSGPLDQHPFFAAQKEAAQKVARTTAALGHPAPAAKAPVRVAPIHAAPAKAAPVPRTPGPASPFGKLPSSALAGAPKLAKAFKSVPAEKPEESHHSLFSLHTLEGLGKDAEGVVHSVYGTPGKTGGMTFKEVAARRALFPGAATAAPVDTSSVLPGLGTAAKNLPSSAVNTITGIVPGLAATGKAVVNAAKGEPKELGQIAKGIGHVIAHPWASFQQNPVGTGLMFAAPAEGVGRSVGTAARAGTFGEKAAQAASVDRAPLYIYGRNTGASTDQIGAGVHDIAIPRTYSPNIIRKGSQVAADTFKKQVLGHNPNIATGEQANRLLYGGGLLGQHVFKPVQGFFKPGLVDRQAGLGEMMRRAYASAASHHMESIKPKVGREAVPLAVEGIIRRPETLVPDLNKELARLRNTTSGLTGKDLKLNKNNQQQITKLLGDQKFLANPHPAFEAARQYAAWSRPLEDRLVQLGHLEPDQLHARNMSYALAHMDHVSYNKTPGNHPLVSVVSSAKRAVKTAETAARKATGDQAKLDARSRLIDAKAAHAKAAGDLQGLKEAGAIKHSGEMYPRLEQKGQPLKTPDIEAHMARNLGDRNVAFLTHKQDQTYGKALESYAGKRPGTEIRSRSGVAFQRGTYDRSWQALKLQAYKNVNAIAGHENRDEMLRRFGIGRFHTEQDAKRAAENFSHTPEGEKIQGSHLGALTPQVIGPDRVIGKGNVETRTLGPALHDFGVADHKGMQEVADTPKYTLLPDTVAKRIAEHDALNKPGPGARTLQWYTNKWRSATLYTSPRWMLGSPQEHAIRLAMQNINPAAVLGAGKAVKVGKALLDEYTHMAADHSLTEAQRYVARAHMAAYHAGTHYGSIAVNSVRRDAQDVADTPMARDLATAFDETTPVSKMIAGWERWKGIIGAGMSNVEKHSQAAALGKMALKQQTKFGSEWRGLITRQDAAIHKFAQGTLAPNESAKLGSDIMDMMGNWTLLTPQVRRAVQTYSPFGLWWLNSMKFVFRTLPKDHPFKTAAFAAMEAGTGQEAKLAAGKSYLAGGIGATLPIVGHVTLTPGYYSPFGIATEAGKTFADQVLPQLTSPLAALRGTSEFTGKELVDANRKPIDLTHRIGVAGKEVAEGVIPGLRQGLQLAQQGGVPEPGSLNPAAVKPGTQRGLPTTLVKMFSPVRMTLGSRNSSSGKLERATKAERAPKAERAGKAERLPKAER